MYEIPWNSNQTTNTQLQLTQSAGAIEYTECISAEKLVPALNECHGYDTKQSDVEARVMLELWEIWSTSIAIAPRLTLSRSGSTW